ncbi:class I SAM-dependent methyltransferase [Anaerotardibacter muris]|uniref:class I SAM-dependent methyltransferase n=1 Tax=Anaerotardibacter muris TaxID=2941505 RepID=UPI00203CED36|nr:methyltransferase domain-containing protein [Anaerotardibacter muris]
MNITWDENEYEKNFSFVHQYGQDVLGLLDVPQGSTVLDLGCGNGALTQALAEAGYQAIGLDDSAEMLAAARKAHPGLDLIHANAIDFTLDTPVDAIFSNAVLHWIDKKNQPALLASVFRALKPGGEFVFECGGVGNAQLIHSALEEAFKERNRAYTVDKYFPSIGDYAAMLEDAGFKVVFATLFDRFTPLAGENGLADWITLFQSNSFEEMNEQEKGTLIQEAVEAIRSELYVDGTWHADYVRLRMKAIKPE